MIGALIDMRIVRYLFSGGMGFVSNLCVYVVCTRLFGIDYIVSAIVAFFCATIVAFTLQKFFTYRHRTMSNIKAQYIQYVIISCIGVFVIAGGLHVLVGVLGMYDIVAQFILNIVVAMVNYGIYTYWIFKPAGIDH